MSSSAAPITATADHVCIADEGSVTVLASSSLRQTSAIPASSVMALHIDPSNNKQNPSLVTTLDVDGSFATHILGVSSTNNRKTAASTTSGKNPNQSSREVFPASSKLTSLSPSPSIATVVAASMHRPAGFSFNITGSSGSNNAAGGKKPLTASALLSCGTVVHHSDVSASTTRKPKILGRHPRMAQLSNLIFAASPTLPLVVVAQPGKKTIFVFYVDPSTLDDDTVSTTQSVQQDQDDTTSQQQQQKNNINKKKNSSNNKKKQNQESGSDNSDNDDDDDDESIDLDIDASTLPTLGGRATNLDPATAGALLPLTIQSPVAISTLTLHPTRPSLAIGSTRGEVCIMHDIFNHTNKNVATGGPHQHNNNKHSSGRHQQMWIDHWHHTPVSALTFGGGQEGTLLLSGASEGVICLWNIGSNYARTNISLGAGVNEVNRVTAIRIAHDEPSKCFVAIGDGEIQLSALDLAHRRLVAKRDGLTIAYSSFSSSYLRKRNLAEGNQETANELLLAPVNNPFAENDSTVVTSPVAWLDGGAVTAVFLYKRNSGKVRLYDPFERRSLRSSVLTTSVETIQNPPTVGLQFVASTPDGKRVACFESSKQKIMPPALKFLVYDEGMNRFRQVQQANDPHPGESSLVGAFWVLNRRGNYVLVTVSKQRVKVWSPLNDHSDANTTSDNADDAQLVSSLLNPAAIATSFKNKKVVADDDQNYLMSCSNDVVLRYHPTLSLLGGSSTHINTATVSADQSLLYLASDVVAAIDLQSLIDQTTTNKNESKDEENKTTPTVHAHIASSSSVSATDKKKNYAISASASSQTAGSIVVAYPHSIAIFGIVVPSPSSSSSSTPYFGCRSVLFDQEKFSVLAVSSPFVGSSSSKQQQQEQQEESDFVVALVASSSTEQQQQQVSAKLYLIDLNSCKIVAAAPWQAKYAPGCRRSLTLLSSVSSSSSSAWRCTVGVATSTRGFRTLNVVLKEEYLDENEEENKKNKKQTAASSKQQQASSSNEDDANALVSLAPVQTVDEEHAVRNREQVSSFFKKIDHFQATSTSTTNSMAIQRQLMMSTAEKVEKGKYAAMYGKEVLGATTFFATPSMSSVTASVFARLEDGGDVEE